MHFDPSLIGPLHVDVKKDQSKAQRYNLNYVKTLKWLNPHQETSFTGLIIVSKPQLRVARWKHSSSHHWSLVEALAGMLTLEKANAKCCWKKRENTANPALLSRGNVTKFRPFRKREEKNRLPRVSQALTRHKDRSKRRLLSCERQIHWHAFTPSNGFNKCVHWKLRLLEPTPLYSFVISLLNLTFAYFFMLNCENTEVIRWPLFSRIPRCDAGLWQYLWKAYRDTQFFSTGWASLSLLNGVKSERKECERLEKGVTDINIYRQGCQTAVTTVWIRSTSKKKIK